MAGSVADLLAARLSGDAAAPLITYYDDATGERTELSGTTLANWVAKTANLLQDGLDLQAGEVVAVTLPPHWQTAAVLLAAWSVGAVVTETVEDADLLVTEEPRLIELMDADVRELLCLSLHPLGGRLAFRPGHVTDYAAEVAGYDDHFFAAEVVDPDALALRVGGLALTGRSLAAGAGELGERLGLGPGDRVLIGTEPASAGGPLPWLLTPLAVGASVVLCRHADDGVLARRAETERVTATLGLPVAGVRDLGAG